MDLSKQDAIDQTSQLSLLTNQKQAAFNLNSSNAPLHLSKISQNEPQNSADSTSFQGQRCASRQKTLPIQNNISGLHEQTRVSIISGNSYQRQSHIAHQQAINLANGSSMNQLLSSAGKERMQRNSTMSALQTQNKIKNPELSPGQKQILSKKSKQSRNEGIFLASSHHTNFKVSKKNQLAQQTILGQRAPGHPTSQMQNLAYMQQSIAKNMGAFDNDSISAIGSQASQHKWASSGARMNDTELLKNIYQRQDPQSTEYLRYYNNLQQLNQQNSELRLAQKNNSSSIFGANRMQNAKSIGLLELRRQLNKNTKRVLSSKQMTLDDDIDLLLAKTNVDPVSTLIDPTQQTKWAQIGRNRYLLNQSSCGKLETWNQTSNIMQNNHISSQVDATSSITNKVMLAPADNRNTTNGFQSLTNFKSLDQEYIQNLQRNQVMHANSNFDRFLQEKILENEADRRIRVQKTSKDQFSLQTRENAMKRSSQSPEYADKHQHIINEMQRKSQNQRRRQIDTSQMLSDLRQSVKAREQNMMLLQQETLGEKMSLAGEQDPPRGIHEMSPFKHDSKSLSQYQSEVMTQENYSSKHYKANPLLLDDQMILETQVIPTKTNPEFKKSTKKRGNKSSHHNLAEMNQAKTAQKERKIQKIINQSNYETAQPTDNKKQSVVLQLEPKSLKEKPTNMEATFNLYNNSKCRKSNQRQKKPRPNENMTVEDIDIYSNQIAALNDNNDFESASHQLNHSGALQNKLMNRPKTNKNSQKKTSTTIKFNDSAYNIQNMDELEKNIDQIFSKSQTDHQGQVKQSNQVSNGSSVIRGGPLPEAYQMEFSKQMKNSRSTLMLEKNMNIQQQLYSKDKNSPTNIQNLKKTEYKAPKTRNGKRFKGMLSNSNTVDDLHTFGKDKRYNYQQMQAIDAQQNQQISGFSEVSSMTKIKKQNLYKLERKVFEHSGNRSAKLQSSVMKPAHQRSKIVKGSVQQSQIGLNAQIKNQELITGIVGKINQNSSAFSEKELGIKLNDPQLLEMRNRSIPRNPNKFKQSSRKKFTKKRSPVMSKTMSGNVSPHQDKKLMKPIKIKKIQAANMTDDDNYTIMKMPKADKFVSKRQYRAAQKHKQDVDNSNERSYENEIMGKDGDLSLSLKHTVMIEPYSQSNHDPLSSPPAKNRLNYHEKNSDYSPDEQVDIGQNNSLIVRKIKRKQKNTLSEPFIFTGSPRHKQQLIMNDPKIINKMANDRERSTVANDARIAALNLSNPRRYQSVMSSFDRPSLRESLLKKGKRPVNHRPQRAHSEYPDFEKDVRESAEEYTAYAKSLYQAVGINANKKRANSAKDFDIRGLKYKFKVQDIEKYTDTLKYGIFNWPVRYCSIGKRKPKPQQRKEALVKEIHFDTLLEILKETDWTKTPLYQNYLEHGRWINDDDEIYSEIEVNYLSSTLHRMMDKGHNIDEFNQAEGQAIIKKHWGKTMSTLKKLMLQMNMMYYWEKLKLHYSKHEQPGHRPKIQQLEKLLLRCKKLYEQIDSFMKIFKLIDVKLLRDQQNSQKLPSEMTEKEISKHEILIKRLIIAICLLLKENPILPISFNFGGECLLEKLKREKENLKQMRLKLPKTQ